MKINIKLKIVILIITFLFCFLKSYSQNLFINENKDTLVIITPKQVNTINCVFLDLELTKKELKLKNELLNNMNSIIIDKDSIINTQSIVLEKKDKYYNNSISQLEKSLNKEKRKTTIYTSTIGGIAIIILGILILK